MKALLFTILLLLNSKFLFGIDPDSLKIKNDDVRIYAKRLTSPIHIDGKLIEPFWQQIEGFEDFIQREPIEGVLPSEKTVVKIAYDDNALYIGVQMFDSSPDSIIARLSRRDNLENSDFFVVGLDPYHDKRSGYFFLINAAGTLVDGVLFNDTYDDDSWDAVWEGEAVIDGLGWTAEMRIPFSQLKFNKSNLNVW